MRQSNDANQQPRQNRAGKTAIIDEEADDL